MPNLVSPTLPTLQILDKTQTEVFPISGFLVNLLRPKTSDGIDMKLGPVTKFDKRNKAASNKFGDQNRTKTSLEELSY